MSHDLITIAAEGGVVTKPKLTHLTTGSALLKFGIVCEPRFRICKDKKKNNMYFTVSVIGKTAETVYPLIIPGTPIRVEGEYKDGTFRDSITDQVRIGRVIYASRVKVLVFWKHRSVGKRKEAEKEEVKKLVMSDDELENLPF